MDISGLKSLVRDLTLNLVTNNYKIEIIPSRRYNTKFRFLVPSRKLIDATIKHGGVLTGSKALRCYRINNNFLLERKTSDWDFIVTQEQAFKICNECKILNVPMIGDTISVKNQRYWRHPDYSDAYRVGPVDVQLIIQSELPQFQEVRGLRFCNLSYLINSKIKLIDELIELTKYQKKDSVDIDILNKHIDDLKQIIIKFNCIKDENT